MVQQVEAIYENGVLRPLEPLSLKESERVRVVISQQDAGAGRSLESMIDHAFLERARAHVANASYVPTLEEVQKQLSSIPDSMAAFIVGVRGEY